MVYRWNLWRSCFVSCPQTLLTSLWEDRRRSSCLWCCKVNYLSKIKKCISTSHWLHLPQNILYVFYRCSPQVPASLCHSKVDKHRAISNIRILLYQLCWEWNWAWCSISRESVYVLDIKHNFRGLCDTLKNLLSVPSHHQVLDKKERQTSKPLIYIKMITIIFFSTVGWVFLCLPCRHNIAPGAEESWNNRQSHFFHCWERQQQQGKIINKEVNKTWFCKVTDRCLVSEMPL